MSNDQTRNDFTNAPSMPYYVHEGAMSRLERIIKKLVLALIITVLLIFASNAIWLYAWLQYDYAGVENVDVNGESGIANYIGNDGNITNGED